MSGWRPQAPEKLLPVLYGCHGLVDVVTIDQAIS